jgi:N4-gp56 family major capsid protein
MANEIKSLSTTLDDIIAPIVQEAMFVANERSIMRGLVKNFTVPQNAGKVLQVPFYPAQTAAALTEADDLTPSAISTSKKDITLAQVGLMTNVSDLALNYSQSSVVADIGRLFGEAIATKMDKDLIGLFTGFSEGQGSAGAELTIDEMFKAVAKLQTASAPGPYVGVFHPKVMYQIKKAMTNTFGGASGNALSLDITNEAMRNGYVGTIAGVQIYESANVVVDGSDDSIGAIFAMDALGLAMGNDITIETQRDASARATEIVGTATYGVSELHDTYGVKLTADSAL